MFSSSEKRQDLHQTLGKYLKKKRMAKDLTQSELGNMLGYSPQFVANWERGASSPPTHVMRKLVSTLKIPEDEILSLLLDQSRKYWEHVIRTGNRRKRS